jgi:hypothetical protein
MRTVVKCLVILLACAALLYVTQRLFSPISFKLDPHNSIRFYSISGTILDEQTHAPIAGAKIFLTDHSEVTCESDSLGIFKLSEIRQWHAGEIGVPAGASDWPSREYWHPYITVSHTNYARGEIAWEYRTNHIILLKKLESVP